MGTSGMAAMAVTRRALGGCIALVLSLGMGALASEGSLVPRAHDDVVLMAGADGDRASALDGQPLAGQTPHDEDAVAAEETSTAADAGAPSSSSAPEPSESAPVTTGDDPAAPAAASSPASVAGGDDASASADPTDSAAATSDPTSSTLGVRPGDGGEVTAGDDQQGPDPAGDASTTAPDPCADAQGTLGCDGAMTDEQIQQWLAMFDPNLGPPFVGEPAGAGQGETIPWPRPEQLRLYAMFGYDVDEMTDDEIWAMLDQFGTSWSPSPTTTRSPTTTTTPHESTGAQAEVLVERIGRGFALAGPACETWEPVIAAAVLGEHVVLADALGTVGPTTPWPVGGSNPSFEEELEAIAEWVEAGCPSHWTISDPTTLGLLLGT